MQIKRCNFKNVYQGLRNKLTAILSLSDPKKIMRKIGQERALIQKYILENMLFFYKEKIDSLFLNATLKIAEEEAMRDEKFKNLKGIRNTVIILDASEKFCYYQT